MLTSRAMATTSFMAGPEDDLIVDDVYAIKDDSVINKIAPVSITSGSLGGGLIDSFRGGLSKALGAVGGVSGLAKIALKAAGPSVLQRISSSSALNGIPGASNALSNVLSSAMRDAPSGLSQSLSGALSSVSGAYATSGGLTSRISSTQIASMYQMSGLFNNVTGLDTISVTDKDSTSRLIGSLATAAMQAGIPKPFSSISSLAGVDTSILSTAGVSMLGNVRSSGNISTLSDITGVIGGDVVRLASSNILSGVAKSYSLPDSATAHDVRTQYDLTTTTFRAVDPTWDSRTLAVATLDALGNPTFDGDGLPLFHDETAINLAPVQNGSPDFLAMMERGGRESSVPEEKFFCMASVFPSSSPEDSLKAKYPLTVSSITSQSTPDVASVMVRSTSNVLTSLGMDNASVLAAANERIRLNRLAQGLAQDQTNQDIQKLGVGFT